MKTVNVVMVLGLATAAIAAIFGAQIKKQVSDIGSPPVAHDEHGRPWFRLASKDDVKQRQIETCFALGEREVVRDEDDRFCCARKDRRWCDMPPGADKGLDGGSL